MCPSYRATRDEKDVTRGRANTLRLAISGQLGSGRAGLRRDDGDAEAVRLLQGLPARVPDRRRHGQDEDRGAGRAGRKPRPVAARPAGRLSPALCAARLALRVARQFAQQQLIAARAVREDCRHQRQARPARVPQRHLPQRQPRRSARPMAPRSCCSPTPSTALTSARISTPRCACSSRAAIACICRSRRAAARPLCCGRTFLSAGLVDEARAELDRLVADLRAVRRARRADRGTGAELPAHAARRVAGAAQG